MTIAARAARAGVVRIALVAAAVCFAGLWGLVSAPAAGGAPASQEARTRPAAQRIVFCSNRSGAWRIWIMNADGSGPKQLTRDPADGDEADDVDPVFSPDGRKVLFTSTRGGKRGVWVMSDDSSKPARICDGQQAEWAPDGKRIVLVRGGVVVTRGLADGKEATISPKGWDKCSGPAWSPDGKTIALAYLKDGANGIYLIPAAGSGQPVKVYDKEGACEPHWSPDGTRLVYETELHIGTINPDGTKNRLVTYWGGVQRYGRFSPDAKHIVFCQGVSEKGPWQIYVVPASGGTPRKLTEGDCDMYPDWRRSR